MQKKKKTQIVKLKFKILDRLQKVNFVTIKKNTRSSHLLISW